MNEENKEADASQEEGKPFSGENLKPEEIKVVKEEAKSQFTGLVGSLRKLFSDTMSIHEGTSVDGTIEAIKKDIDFKGVNVWILIFSIFIASIGLSTDSTAVVIGAMLISPLMGPILGMGLSIGINDWITLKRSVRSFGIATVISILTSFIYFLILQQSGGSSELLARTQPTLLDAMIGIMGGLAGAIAVSRKEKSNVVPGVAIATALMPPLCTAGFGLASGNLSWFFGALYLFFLNSLFICLSTYFVVRYLRFPLVQFVDQKREKKARRYIIVFVIVVLLPSMYLFSKVIRENRFESRANAFVVEAITFGGSTVSHHKLHYTDSIPEIEVFIVGDPISDINIKHLEGRLKDFDLSENFMFDKTKLVIRQGKDATAETDQKLNQLREEFLDKMYTENLRSIQNKDEKIAFLESQILRFQKDSIPFNSVFREAGSIYVGIQEFGFANMVHTDTLAMTDTVPSFFIRWDSTLKEEDVRLQQEKMKTWLSVRLDLDTLTIFHY